jgi:cytochrome c oxidase assembly protein subunit 15
MNGKLIPDGLFEQTPLWRNFFENIVTVQFDHRVLATILFTIIPVFWFKAGKIELQSLARTGTHLLLAALILQITLGISTLLLVVPVALAAAHQAGAIVLLTAALFVSQQLHR